ncbi:TPA: adenosine deaminase [Burkholderia vietnamiensis]|nr:adenosine deaminase [Burkholderia vietnamiensis]
MQTAHDHQTTGARTRSTGRVEASKPTRNANLGAARLAKNDEFYTLKHDIENEVKHYRQHFKGKVVFCNCDDPEQSNFWIFFHQKFDDYGLKRLVATHYARDGKGAGVLMCHDESRDEEGQPIIETKPLQGDGDFRSKECVDLLETSDIVCTNPPFSLFREFITLITEKNKQFLVIGSQNAVTTKDVFPLIKSNRLWLGVSKPTGFRTPSGEMKTVGTYWYTNLEHKRRKEEVDLVRSYEGNREGYPSYDNFDAIECGKVANIPMDFDGVMGVPTTFLENYNPSQFEIVSITMRWSPLRNKTYEREPGTAPGEAHTLNGGATIKVKTAPVGKTPHRVGDSTYVKMFPRLLIRRKTSAQ